MVTLMSENTLLLTILSGAGAVFGLLGCLYAAYRHPYKRGLYIVTAALMVYFIWLVVRVVISSVAGAQVTAPYFREAIGALFLAIGAHGFLDGKLRGT